MQPDWPRIIVCGGGTAALLAAALLGRLLPAGHVTLVETPPAPDAAEHCTRLWPDAQALHGRIGLTEALLQRHAGATLLAAESFGGWPAPRPWLLPADAEWAGHAALQAWLRTPEVPVAEWLQARAPHGSAALRIDPVGYRALLARLVASLPVRRLSAETIGVERAADGTVAALLCAGERLVSDWIVDATGPAALIATAIGATERAIEQPTVALASGGFGAAGSGPVDHWQATPESWTLTLGDASSPQLRGLAASDAFLQCLTLPIRRRDPWTGNVLALGSASFTPDPLTRMDLLLVHSALLRLAANLPGRRVLPAEQAELARHVLLEQDSARDYALCLAQIARPGPFWTRATSLPRSAELENLRDQLDRRGRLPTREDSAIPHGQWRVLLAAMGHHPARPDALARNDAQRVMGAGR
ncbi:tryptophan 7-halogenase [Croceibacterium ferulae]|uniref:tryptophan 7-halogenase n=1 Tax=Croceibacterium ferulae TaxID=1854641 RepID=UPI000EB3B929|nr:tryptophan 7-halogenase [Croceibacterium ferulae]